MRCASLVLLSLAACLGHAQSRALIAWNPGHPASEELAYALAREIDTELNLSAVLWTLSDPVLRDAVNFGGLKFEIEKPSRDESRRVGGLLKADLVIWIEGKRDPDGLAGSIEVFRPNSGRAVWRKSGRSQVVVDGTGTGSASVDAMARTWMVELLGGAFKPYVKVQGLESTPPAPGVEIIPNPQPPSAPEAEWLDRAAALQKEGKPDEALSVLYAAVDAFPTRLPVRLALLEALRRAGQATESLGAARSTLLLFPEASALRREVIQGLLATGNMDAASTEINESLARFPDDPDFVVLSGDWSLFAGRPERARAQYLRAMTLRPDPETTWALATALAWDGDPVELASQLRGLDQPPPTATDRSRMALRTNLEALAEGLREALRLRRVGNAEAGPLGIRTEKRVRAVGALVPKTMPTDNRLALACNLLQQAAGQVLSFTQSGDPDMGAEAQISLADALRRFRELGYLPPR